MKLSPICSVGSVSSLGCFGAPAIPLQWWRESQVRRNTHGWKLSLSVLLKHLRILFALFTLLISNHSIWKDEPEYLASKGRYVSKLLYLLAYGIPLPSYFTYFVYLLFLYSLISLFQPYHDRTSKGYFMLLLCAFNHFAFGQKCPALTSKNEHA